MRRFVLVLPFVLLGCSTVPAVPRDAAPVVLSDGLRWMRASAEYRGIALQTYGAALTAAERLSAGKPRGSWAVSVDVDETLLANSTFQKELQESRSPYSEAAWSAWVKRDERTAVPGATAFLEGVRRLGGRVAVVTNTAGSLCGDVGANLDARSLPYDLLLCRPDGAGESKESRWRGVEAGTAREGVGPLELLVFVGDNIQDFPGKGQQLRRGEDGGYAGFGVRYFLLPNPVYGSWTKNPSD